MEKIHGNMHVLVLSCTYLQRNVLACSMYFLHLVHTFSTQNDAMVNGKLELQFTYARTLLTGPQVPRPESRWCK